VTLQMAGRPGFRRPTGKALGVVSLLIALAAPAVPVRAGQQQPVAAAGQAQPPPPQPGAPGAPGGGAAPPGAPRKTGKEKEKEPEKFGPISLMPLQHAYASYLGAGPVVDPATDGSLFFNAIKGKQVAAWAVRDGVLKWVLSDLVAVQPLAVDQERLYVVLDGEIATFDPATSKPLWRVPSGGKVTAPAVVKAGWVILALDTGELRALRGETGETVWQMKFDAEIKAAPVIVGDRLYVAPQNNHLVALDLLSGQKLWDQQFEGFVTAIGAQEHRVFAGTGRMFYGLDHAGHMKWKRRLGAEVIGQIVTDESTVYAAFTDNTLVAFGANNGDLRWRAGLAYRPISGPVRGDDTLLLTGIAPVVHGYAMKDGKPAPDFALPVDPRSIVAAAPLFTRGATFFQDTVLVVLAQGVMEGARRLGPGTFMPFVDPGTALPPFAFPGEPPPPSAAGPVKP
jgi:outer membrane protein assembly factor BamB